MHTVAPKPLLAVITTILLQLQTQPAVCAMQFRERRISNSALLAKVLRLARRFAELGIGPQYRVAVCMERCPEQVVALLALWQNAAVYVPFDPALPRDRLLDMCSVAKVTVLLTHPHLQAQLSTLPVQVLTLAEMDFSEPAQEATQGQTPPQAHPAAHPAALRSAAHTRACEDTADTSTQPGLACATPAYILFTSGSTGLPKGVLISQHNLATLFAGLASVLPPCAGRRVLGCAASGFDIAFFELLAPLLGGGTIVLAGQDCARDPQALAALIVKAEVDIIQATPSLWQLLNHHDWNPQHRDIVALATGEALPRALAATLLTRSSQLWNLYGPTECTIWATAHRVSVSDVGDDAPAIVSIGKALPHVELKLHEAGAPASTAASMDKPWNTGPAVGADARHDPEACAAAEPREHAAYRVSTSATGELWIGGATVGIGYCDAAALNEAAFSTTARPPAAGTSAPPLLRWYRSGDQCRRDADGNLHFLGRLDAQVKVNGYRIELDEINRLLLKHPSIRDAVCVTRALPDGHGTLLFACVVFIPGRPNKNRDGLNQYLARFLPQWMLPHRYCFLSELPLTPNGKLDRAALLELTTAASPQHSPLHERTNQTREGAPASRLQGSLQMACDTQTSVLAERVAALFCEILDIACIGPCDSFLDVGGSSMLSASLVMLLNQRFGARLTLRQTLATPPTVQSIVKLLQAQELEKI